MLIFRLFRFEWFDRRDWGLEVANVETWHWEGSLVQVEYLRTYTGMVQWTLDFLWLRELTELIVDKWKGFS